MSQPIPAQELIAIDLHGNQWRFKHSYRGNNSFYLYNSNTAIEVINPTEVINKLLIPCKYPAETQLVGMHSQHQKNWL